MTLTPDEAVTRLRAEHQPFEARGGPVCRRCNEDWPCPTVVVLDRLEAAEARADRNALLYIKVSNPGVDMDEVHRILAEAKASTCYEAKGTDPNTGRTRRRKASDR